MSEAVPSGIILLQWSGDVGGDHEEESHEHEDRGE
jgi:hypothetical protein